MKAIINEDHHGTVRSIDIISDSDGRRSFTIYLISNTQIEIGAGDFVKDGDNLYDDSLEIIPCSSNLVKIRKPLYE